MATAFKCGLRNMPTVLFTLGVVIGDVPQTEEEKAFEGKEFEEGVSVRIFADITRKEVDRIFGEVNMVSSSFVAWKGEGPKSKARFAINFSRHSKYWPRPRSRWRRCTGFLCSWRRGTA